MSKSPPAIENGMDALAVCLIRGAEALYKAVTPQSEIKQKLQYVWESGGVFAKRMLSGPEFPKVIEIKKQDTVIEIKLILPSGLFPELVQDRKPLLDSALQADCEIWAEKGIVHILAHTLELPRKVNYNPKLIQRLSNYDLAIPIGISRAGFEVLQLTSGFCHLLIGGATDWGKSVELRVILAAMHQVYNPKQLQLVLGDLKRGNEFKLFKESPLVQIFSKNVKELEEALKWLNEELDRRATILEPTPFENISQYNKYVDDDKKLPFLVLVIDEFAEVPERLKGTSNSEKKREKYQEAKNTVYSLLRMGRSHGIHCIICTQRPTVDTVPGGIKMNCSARISFNMKTEIDSRTILDHGAAAHLEPIQGRAIYDAKRQRTIQGFWLSPANCKQIVQWSIEKYGRTEHKPEYIIET